MANLSALASYDLLRFVPSYLERLKQAQEAVAKKRGLAREKGWLSDALAVLDEASSGSLPVLERARRLPELADASADLLDEARNVWVDGLEKLLAGIVFHAGSRAPVIEAVFPHQKFPALRRNEEAAKSYASELERRMKSGYVTRMLGGPDLAFTAPVLEALAQAAAEWRNGGAIEALPETEAAATREELASLAARVELAFEQARLLAQAALASVSGVYDELALGQRPKKRSPKVHAAPTAAASEPAPQEKAETSSEPAPSAAPSSPKKKQRRAKAAQASA